MVPGAHVTANGIPSELGVGPAHHRRYVIGVLIWKAVGKPVDDSLNGLIFISGRYAASLPVAALSHKADELLPRAIGHGSLALALSAYEQWLESADASSAELVDAAMAALVRTREFDLGGFAIVSQLGPLAPA